MFSRAYDLTLVLRRSAERCGLNKFTVALIDQVLVSGAGFLVGLYMARNFAKAEYAFYIMVITLCQIMVSYQNALLNTPLLVLREEAGPGYARGAELLNLYLAGAVVLCTGLAAVSGGAAVFPAALFFGVFLVKEFRKNLLYADLDLGALLQIDAVYLVFMIVMLLIGVGTWWMIFPVMFAGHACSLLCSRRRAQGGKEIMGAMQVVVENRLIAAWSLVGVTATVLQNRSYVYLTTVILSPEVLADLSVTRMIMMPLALCVGSSGKIIVVWGRRALAGGEERAFRRGIGILTTALALVAVCYVTMLHLAYPPLNDLVFDGKYDGLQGYIVLWGIYFLVQMFRFVLSNSLQAMRKFRELALVGVVSGALVPLIGIVLIPRLGGSGALVSLICGEVVLMGYLLQTFRRSKVPGDAGFKRKP